MGNMPLGCSLFKWLAKRLVLRIKISKNYLQERLFLEGLVIGTLHFKIGLARQ